MIADGSLEARAGWKSSKKFFNFKLTTRSYVFRLLSFARTRRATQTAKIRIVIHDEHCQPTCQRSAGPCVVLQRMAAGSRAADADEQPRSRGCRTSRRSRRLRRLRPRRAQLGGVRRHRRDAARSSNTTRHWSCNPENRSPCSAPTVGASRPYRQRAARARVGELGHVPRSRGPRADDVRADDGRELDLHRHAGHSAGHLRDAGRTGAPPLRRHPCRPRRRHRRPWRHGRRAAARGHDERVASRS